MVNGYHHLHHDLKSVDSQKLNLIQYEAINRSDTDSHVYSCLVSDDTQDVVIIGGGPGGYVAAIKAAQLGLKVGKERACLVFEMSSSSYLTNVNVYDESRPHALRREVLSVEHVLM